MDYEIEYHTPGIVESLIQQKNNGELPGFENALETLCIIMRGHPLFLKALDEDQGKRVERRVKLFNDTKKLILKALNDEESDAGITITHNLLTQLEQVYHGSEMQYMNDVITTCVSYHSTEHEDGVRRTADDISE